MSTVAEGGKITNSDFEIVHTDLGRNAQAMGGSNDVDLSFRLVTVFIGRSSGGDARVAELADALDSKSSGRKVVGVRFPPLVL